MVVAVPESVPVPSCRFGTVPATSRSDRTPSRSRKSLVSAVTASGVFIRFISRFDAVTMISSSLSSTAASEYCASTGSGVTANAELKSARVACDGGQTAFGLTDMA